MFGLKTSQLTLFQLNATKIQQQPHLVKLNGFFVGKAMGLGTANLTFTSDTFQ